MLSIAYISNQPEKKARVSKREQLHREAIATLSVRREMDRKAALKTFAYELKELNQLELKLKADDKFYKRKHGV